MCLTVLLGDLGPGHGALDSRRRVLILSPVLSQEERVLAARRLLAGAGYEQPYAPAEVVCLCGKRLDLNLPIESLPEPRPFSEREETVRQFLTEKGPSRDPYLLSRSATIATMTSLRPPRPRTPFLLINPPPA